MIKAPFHWERDADLAFRILDANNVHVATIDPGMPVVCQEASARAITNALNSQQPDAQRVVHTPKVGRYEVGYNRPVDGAVGNSPCEWHSVARTHDLERAKVYLKNTRDNGHSKAAIIDTTTNLAVTP